MNVTQAQLTRLQDAVVAVEKEANLPRRDEMLSMLREARDHAIVLLANPLEPDAALGDGEQSLALALSALSGSAPPSRGTTAYELFGARKYEIFDTGWLGALFHYISASKVPFPTHDPAAAPGARGSGIVSVADDVTFAMSGDWGTGDASSFAIASCIRALSPPPSYTIHLGDVYYSGTPEEEHDRLVTPWPVGVHGAFALNSNHEMYSGGKGYFEVALGSPKFGLQGGRSYFAIENRSWIIFGLDTAYPAHSFLYQKGDLDEVQLGFLERHSARARAAGKRIMVLSHHHPIDMSGKPVHPLCDKVTKAVGPGELFWYWGHVHGVAVFDPIVVNGVDLMGRCIGHGGVPYAPIKCVKPMVWTESELAGDPLEKRRAFNGFLVVRLAGAQLVESLHGEDGSVRYERVIATVGG